MAVSHGRPRAMGLVGVRFYRQGAPTKPGTLGEKIARRLTEGDRPHPGAPRDRQKQGIRVFLHASSQAPQLDIEATVEDRSVAAWEKINKIAQCGGQPQRTRRRLGGGPPGDRRHPNAACSSAARGHSRSREGWRTLSELLRFEPQLPDRVNARITAQTQAVHELGARLTAYRP